MATASTRSRQRQVIGGVIVIGVVSCTTGLFLALGAGWGLIVLGLAAVILGVLCLPAA
jgi:hypothetical protein